MTRSQRNTNEKIFRNSSIPCLIKNITVLLGWLLCAFDIPFFHFIFSLYSPRISHFSKELWFLLLEVFRNHNLGMVVLITTGTLLLLHSPLVDWTSLSTLSGESQVILINAGILTHLHTHVPISIHPSKHDPYWCFWLWSCITGFILVFLSCMSIISISNTEKSIFHNLTSIYLSVQPQQIHKQL